MTKISKTFCILPWIHLATKPDGSARLCCYTRSIIKKEDSTNFKFGVDKISDIWQSNYMKDVRLKMASGESVEFCEKCYSMESLGTTSKRMLCNEADMIDNIEEIVEDTVLNNGVTKTNPTFFDLRLGNLCNLKCRMCNPLNSSQIQKEYSTIKNNSIRSFSIEVPMDINTWFLTDEFWGDLENYIPYINHLYFTGGEPTLIEQHYTFLEEMINRGFSENIILRYNTNLTNTQPRFMNILKNFKTVRLACSIDGYGKIDEYIRSPSKWETIVNNFTTYITEVPHVTLSVASALQALNVLYYRELYEWLYDINKQYNRDIAINVGMVNKPPHLSVDILTPELKQEALRRLEGMDTSYIFRVDRLEALKNKLREPEPSDIITLRDKFKTFTRTLDSIRNENLLDVAPELSVLYQD